MKVGRFILAVMLVFALIALPTAGYVTAYIALGEYRDWRGNMREGEPTAMVERQYRQAWMMTLFEPAARIESWWIGCRVYPTWSEIPGPALTP